MNVPPPARGLLVVLSGPSGVGKTTLCERLCSLHGWKRVVTATTRPPRGGERDGVDYHFLSDGEFERRVRANGFLEHARVFSRRYGTPREAVEAPLVRGEVLLLPIDVQGAAQVRVSLPSALRIFLLPPDLSTLEARLSGRGTEDEARRAERLRVARDELARQGEYDHRVVNGDLGQAERDIARLVEIARSGKGLS
ncbi:MAG: guanylate kinase [Planctomycetes bacterium]|nr:guanylate kinase [Planctomycetota bacterium]